MKHILVYRNPHCERCARFARMHRYVDWFNRIAATTDTPRTGPLKMGEIVVEELADGRIWRGADALALIYRQAIVYWPLLPLLRIPPLRAWLDREVRRGSDGSCQADPARTNTGRISTRV